MFGVVKFFLQKGYGFVTADDGLANVWIGSRVLRDSKIDVVDEGDRVEFEFETNDDGRRCATTLRKLAPGAAR
jgi:cold shock CspA family protein